MNCFYKKKTETTYSSNFTGRDRSAPAAVFFKPSGPWLPRFVLPRIASSGLAKDH